MTTSSTKSTLGRHGWRTMGATLLVALAGSLAQAQPMGPGGGHGGHGGGPGGHGGMMMLHGRALEAIGATADQQTRIREIFKAARDDVRKQHEAAGDLRAQMMAVFTATTVDARAAEAVRVKMAAVREADSKRMLQAMIDAAALLSPEQRQKLAEQMGKRREMMQRHHRERSALDGGAPKR